MLKILVTGAAGLVGSHLCDELIIYGYEVHGADNLSFGSLKNLNNDLIFHNIDLSDSNSLDNLPQYDLIIHLASCKKTFEEDISSSEMMRINFQMTDNIVKYCISRHCKLIFSSTSDVYGNSNEFDESEDISFGPPNIPRYSYALSKFHSEQYILNNVASNKLDAKIIRIFGCTSPRASVSWSGGHVPLFIDRALKNKEIFIHGDGHQTRSISHATDIAKGFMSLAQRFDKIEKGEIINLGTDEEMSVLDCAKYIIDVTKSQSKITFIPTDQIFKGYNEIKRRWANTRKAKQLLDYKVNFTTKNVIDEMIVSFTKSIKNI